MTIRTRTEALAGAVEVTRQADLIIDIGMDTGQDTEFYLKKGFRVVGVDANPMVCSAVAERFSEEIAAGRLTIINRAISDSSETLDFYVCKTTSMLSTADANYVKQQEKDGHKFETVRVQGISLPEIIGRETPHFLKIDIEGYDIPCLEQLLRCEVRPPNLSTELDLKRPHEHLDLLCRLGYRHFALVPQRSVKHQTPPRPAREGRYSEHAFLTHSSGLFGRELPYAWMRAWGMSVRLWSLLIELKWFGLLRRLGKIVPPLEPLMSRVRGRMAVAGQWYDLHARLEPSTFADVVQARERYVRGYTWRFWMWPRTVWRATLGSRETEARMRQERLALRLAHTDTFPPG